jgi:hypothetical protein
MMLVMSLALTSRRRLMRRYLNKNDGALLEVLTWSNAESTEQSFIKIKLV